MYIRLSKRPRITKNELTNHLHVNLVMSHAKLDLAYNNIVQEDVLISAWLVCSLKSPKFLKLKLFG